MMASMERKVIAVTDGATGIGLAIGCLFGAEGVSVALIDMNGEEAQRQNKLSLTEESTFW